MEPRDTKKTIAIKEQLLDRKSTAKKLAWVPKKKKQMKGQGQVSQLSLQNNENDNEFLLYEAEIRQKENLRDKIKQHIVKMREGLNLDSDVALEEYDRMYKEIDEKGWLVGKEGKTQTTEGLLDSNLMDVNQSRRSVTPDGLGFSQKNGANNWKSEDIVESGQLVSTFRTDLSNMNTSKVPDSYSARYHSHRGMHTEDGLASNCDQHPVMLLNSNEKKWNYHKNNLSITTDIANPNQTKGNMKYSTSKSKGKTPQSHVTPQSRNLTQKPSSQNLNRSTKVTPKTCTSNQNPNMNLSGKGFFNDRHKAWVQAEEEKKRNFDENVKTRLRDLQRTIRENLKTDPSVGNVRFRSTSGKKKFSEKLLFTNVALKKRATSLIKRDDYGNQDFVKQGPIVCTSVEDEPNFSGSYGNFMDKKKAMHLRNSQQKPGFDTTTSMNNNKFLRSYNTPTRHEDETNRRNFKNYNKYVNYNKPGFKKEELSGDKRYSSCQDGNYTSCGVDSGGTPDGMQETFERVVIDSIQPKTTINAKVSKPSPMVIPKVARRGLTPKAPIAAVSQQSLVAQKKSKPQFELSFHKKSSSIDETFRRKNHIQKVAPETPSEQVSTHKTPTAKGYNQKTSEDRKKVFYKYAREHEHSPKRTNDQDCSGVDHPNSMMMQAYNVSTKTANRTEFNPESDARGAYERYTTEKKIKPQGTGAPKKTSEFHQSGSLMFEGNVRDSKRVGYGILYHENGAVKYSGNFKSNNIHGKGIKVFHDNATLGFEGDIIEGRKENFGRLWHK